MLAPSHHPHTRIWLPSSVGTTGGVTTTYTYTGSGPGSINELQVLGRTASITTYGYDQSGDTTSITRTGALSTGLSYDTQARLSQVTLADGTSVVMRYNSAGLRARYTVSKAGTTSLDERFTYRGDALAQAAVVSGTATYTDTYLYDPNGQPLELLRQQNGSTSRYWYAEDGRGIVVALTDPNGNVVDRYGYDAWGAPLAAQTSESVPQPFRYAGYWWDAALGWYWVSVRPYDPQLKRWLQPDPSEQDGVHTYVYVGDDPVDARDPSGLLTCSGSHDVFSFIGDAACNVGNFAGNAGQGVWSGVVDTAQGFGSLGHGALNSTAAVFYDPRAFEQQWQANGALASYIAHNPVAAGKAVVVGLVARCGNAIHSGNVGRAVGRCGFDLIMLAGGTKGLTKLGELSGVGRVSRITRLLQGHVNVASTRYTFTPKQLAAIARNPALEAAFKGDRIDALAKQLAAADPRLKGIVITG